MGVLVVAEADCVEGALVQDDVPTVGLGAVKDSVEGPRENIPLLELDGSWGLDVGLGVSVGLFGGGDLTGEGDALGAVVDAKGAAGPGFVAKGEEEGAVAAAEIKESGVVAGDGQVVDEKVKITVSKAVEEVEYLCLGVGIVEPDGTDVGGVGGVVGDFASVEVIPAVWLEC